MRAVAADRLAPRHRRQAAAVCACLALRSTACICASSALTSASDGAPAATICFAGLRRRGGRRVLDRRGRGEAAALPGVGDLGDVRALAAAARRAARADRRLRRRAGRDAGGARRRRRARPPWRAACGRAIAAAAASTSASASAASDSATRAASSAGAARAAARPTGSVVSSPARLAASRDGRYLARRAEACPWPASL